MTSVYIYSRIIQIWWGPTSDPLNLPTFIRGAFVQLDSPQKGEEFTWHRFICRNKKGENPQNFTFVTVLEGIRKSYLITTLVSSQRIGFWPSPQSTPFMSKFYRIRHVENNMQWVMDYKFETWCPRIVCNSFFFFYVLEYTNIENQYRTQGKFDCVHS